MNTNLAQFAHGIGTVILDVAPRHGWIIEGVSRSPRGSCYIELRNAESRKPLTVRIADHPAVHPRSRLHFVRTIQPNRDDVAARLASLFRYLARHADRWRKCQRKRGSIVAAQHVADAVI